MSDLFSRPMAKPQAKPEAGAQVGARANDPQPAQPKPVKPTRYGRDTPRPLAAGVSPDVARRCMAPGCGAWAAFGVDAFGPSPTYWCGPHAPDATWRHVPGGRPAFLQGGAA